jgi:RNA polymerase sigma-54 factor
MSAQGLSQRQVQTLRLSPQQILYTKLLQLPVLQLEQRIKQELEENPVLEEATDEEKNDELQEQIDDLPAPELPTELTPVELLRDSGNETETPETEAPPDEKAHDDTDFESEIEEMLREQDEEGYKTQPSLAPNESSNELQPIFEESWRDELLKQLRLLKIEEKEYAIAEEIIGNLDEDGYLRCSFDIIREGLLMQGIEANEKEIEAVLEKIWQLEPAGAGARNLQECLLIQLHALADELDDEHEEDRQLAQRILVHHFNEFSMMHYQKLMQVLGISQAQLRRAVQLIQKLNPKPIRSSSESVRYIVPDFIVTFNGEELIVAANERSIPQVRISRRYKEMLEDKRQERGTREFIRQKIEAAKGFMSAIEMRRHTMQKIMNAIVHRQYEFFAVGPEKLKPMILKDIAEDAGVDISTVSRVVNGKYVQTDKGIWELKYFFSTAVETESGDEISNRVIKQFIKDFIEKEESGKPLSDDKLAELLAQHGYKVARRTVTKYREQLNIPVARLRKKIEATE